MKIVVDTNVIIDYLRTSQKDKTVFHSLFVAADHTAVINLITVAELYAGQSLTSIKTKIVVDKIIDSCEIMKDNVEIYKLAGEIIRNNYCSSLQDAVIAASAVFFQLPLLTLNLKDFKRVKQLMLHKIQS